MDAITDWYKWPWDQCRAVFVGNVRPSLTFRCERKKYHRGDHATEHGMDIPSWVNIFTN